MTSLPSPRLRICMRSALTWLALACAAVGSTEHSHVPLGILSASSASTCTGLDLKKVAQVVAREAADRTISLREEPWRVTSEASDARRKQNGQDYQATR